MSLVNNPRVVTNGLVMYYDANNVKSYVGPPLKNILTQIAPAGIGSSTGYVATTGSETVNIPQLGDTFVNYVTIQNNYTAYAPNSSNCCPSLYQYGGGTLLPSTLYTYAIVYKCESGYTGANFMYQYDYNGGTYVTEFGLHSTSQRTHLGGGWYWAWATFTTQATVNTLNSSGLWYYQYSSGVDKITVAKAMMVQGNYTSLHPKYWPALNTTRSTTQAIVDLTGQDTLTATSLTYSTTGAFSFTSANNSIIAGALRTISFADGVSFEVIITLTDLASRAQGALRFTGSGSQGASNYLDIYFPGNGKVRWETIGNYPNGNITTTSFVSASTLANNTTYHILCTATAAGAGCIYINGVLDATATFTSPVFGTVTTTVGTEHGGYPSGSIPVAKIYNRALSAGEVTQNFNALRGRYSL